MLFLQLSFYFNICRRYEYLVFNFQYLNYYANPMNFQCIHQSAVEQLTITDHFPTTIIQILITSWLVNKQEEFIVHMLWGHSSKVPPGVFLNTTRVLLCTFWRANPRWSLCQLFAEHQVDHFFMPGSWLIVTALPPADILFSSAVKL